MVETLHIGRIGASIAMFARRTFLLDGRPSTLHNQIKRLDIASTMALYEANVCAVTRQ